MTSDAHAQLQGFLDATGAGTGAQLSIRSTDDHLDIAVGHACIGSRSDVATLHPAFCLTKLVLYAGVLDLIDRGNVSLDEPLGARLGDHPALPPYPVTLRCLLSHTAGLDEPQLATWRLAPPAERAALLGGAQPRPGPAYSEVRAGLIHLALIEHCTGVRAGDWLEEDLLKPLDLLDQMAITPHSARRLRHRFDVPAAPAGPRMLPLLSEVADLHLADVSPNTGGWATASGITTLLHHLVTSSRSRGGVLSHLIDSAASPRPHRQVDRPVAFAGGLMVGTLDPGGPWPSDRSVGHSGGITLMFTLHDLPSTTTATMICNTVDFDPTRIERRRSAALALIASLIS